MSTIHLHQTTTSTPEQYVAGLTDFGPGRAKLFGNSTDKYMKVHRFGPWQILVEGEKHHDESKTYRRNNDAWSNFGPQRIWQGRDFNYAFVLSLGLLLSSGRADSNVTQVAGTQKGGASSDGKDAIRPFRVNVPKEQIVDLRRRIAATCWPDKETVNDESRGHPVGGVAGAGAVLGQRLQLAQSRSEVEYAAGIRDHNRRRGYPVHPRAFA